ncbi:MAG: anhydro-N-acetylmuramic acid kinase [Ignavibacteria bacterium]|nr:anhydro-N-acetylmuramic acid kinase [Ignavibacteria bacterium]
MSIADVSFLTSALTEFHASAVVDACTACSITPEQLDGIGFHGQTVWHAPKPTKKLYTKLGNTLQLTSGQTLAALLSTTVVSDFRSADVALGGQGAPLVPLFDSVFLRDSTRNVIALNIGGIANITLLPASKAEPVIAFDTGPGNVLIDASTTMFFGKNYDKNGSIAAAGRPIRTMLEQLKDHKFISQKPPKSTGREVFNKSWLEKRIRTTFQPSIPSEDVVRTITEFTSWSIAENIRLFADPTSKIIASGGGIHNKTLMQLLKNELPKASIITSDEIGINSDAKEALCFAFLAYRTLGGLTGNIPSVTGASREAILGSVSKV